MKNNKKNVSIALAALMLAMMTTPAMAEGPNVRVEGGKTKRGEEVISTYVYRGGAGAQADCGCGAGQATTVTAMPGENGAGIQWTEAQRAQATAGAANERQLAYWNSRGAARNIEWTDEQKAALEQAEFDQAAAQDVFVANLVAAGVYDQAMVDAQARVDGAADVAATIDTLQWTMQKNIDLKDALNKGGAEKAAVLAQFVAEGLLTQEQADALYMLTTAALQVNLDNLTVAQLKDLQGTTAPADFVTKINGFVEIGLMSRVDADLLLAKRMGYVSAAALTDGQKAAIQAAREELTATNKAIADRMVQLFMAQPAVDTVTGATPEAVPAELVPAVPAEGAPAATEAPKSVG